jgi:hypothetical protein
MKENDLILDESHKLDPWPLNENPRPKNGKSRLNLHGTILESKSISSNKKFKKLKKATYDLKSQVAS